MPALNAVSTLLEAMPPGLVWSGKRMASCNASGLPTGFPELDAELPDRGWPRGTIIELLGGSPGIGELRLLQPTLGSTPARRWVGWIAPPMLPYPPALAEAGIPLSRMMVVDTHDSASSLWACRQALASTACHAVLAWLPRIDTAGLRRLQLAAEAAGTPLFLFRPESAARHASPAGLRLHLEASAESLLVRILKRRGPASSAPLHIDFATHVHAVDRTHAPRPAASGTYTRCA
jgi:cell division inhibitor SulA/protein ImuA